MRECVNGGQEMEEAPLPAVTSLIVNGPCLALYLEIISSSATDERKRGRNKEIAKQC